MRYNNIKTSNKKYKTIILPVILLSDTDTIILTKHGDRLDILAKKYYNDVSLW